MKKAVAILIVLIFSLLYYRGALTTKETFPFSKESFSSEMPPPGDQPLDLRGIWSSKSKIGDRKPSATGIKELEQIYQQKLDKGVKNLPLFSFFLIREAEEARLRGDSEEALRIATYAVKFSPDLPDPSFELARVLWHQNPFQVHKIVPEVLSGVRAQLHYYPSSLTFFYNLFYLVSNAILMTFIVFGITILMKYLPLYFYDVRKNLGQEFSRILINWLKIFLLFIPFFLSLDMLWAILFWSILLWGFVTERQKQLIILFLVLLVYLPFLLRSSSTVLDGKSFDILQGMNRANYEDWDGNIKRELKTWLTNHPDDSELLFTLGLIEKRQGRYPEAEDFYRKAIQQNPRFSEAFSNLGNVYLAKKQLDLAIASYQKAADLNSNKGAYYYNLSRAYSQETFLSGKSEKAFGRARQLDPKLVDYYSGIDSPALNRLVIDEVLGTERLWRRFLVDLLGREGFLFPLFKAWFEKVPSRIGFLVPLFFLGFLIGMSRYSRTKKFLTRCPMCGSPTYRFYLGSSDQEFVCFNCHRIFIQKEKVHVRIAEKKSLQVGQFKRQDHLLSKFLSFVFVGFSDVWGKRPVRGLLFLFVFFIFILRFAYWNGVMTSSVTPPSPCVWGMVVWGALFILFYFLSARQTYRLKPRSEEADERPRKLVKPRPPRREGSASETPAA